MLKKSVSDAVLLKQIKQTLTELRAYVAENTGKQVPLHGDFAPQNIVISDDGKMRVLDFERARIGDALWDYAYYYGWLQRADAEVAVLWKALISEHMAPAQMTHFNEFVVLFHAWTVRDIFEYKKNSLRARRAEKSIKILQTLL